MSWIEVDYDDAKWLWVPQQWEGMPWSGPAEWAEAFAEAWWLLVDVDPGGDEEEVARLRDALLEYATRAGTVFPGQDLYLYMPDPRQAPVPLAVWGLATSGDRNDRLRELVRSMDPEAVEAPIVELFRHPHLGNGLRAMRYFTDPGDGTLGSSLNYAFRSEPHGVDVLVRAISADVGRLAAAAQDMDELALAVRVRRDEDR
ncbi:hypothetical protein [Streptomyces sp. 184]|uniref:hypothetical protein n=1 Tax=Streptomyces sp. 184 TaxID=1827526 RepID=UPI0038920557